MKLFLSSYQIGNYPDKLTEIIGSNRRAALIMNATDSFGDEKRPFYVSKYQSQFKDLGIDLEELDLRNFFSRKDQLEKKLSEFGLIWAAGGNTFSLRWAMSLSGFDKVLPNLLNQTDIVYGGFSAGACVLSPTLKGTHLVDDPQKIPTNELQWEGLGLIDFCIVPHFRSNHPESAVIENVVDYYEKNKIKHLTQKTVKLFVYVIIKSKNLNN